MAWTVIFHEAAEAEFLALPEDVQARLERIKELVAAFGLERVPMKYARHVEDKLWEFRLKGKDGIARALYVAASGQRIVIVRRVRQEDPEDTASGDQSGSRAVQGDHMTGMKKAARKKVRLVPADAVFAKARKNPAYARAYDALQEEFDLVTALIKARIEAGLTQQQVAERMKTTQAVIARLEAGGRRPSTRTLERFARATGHRLKISFEPGYVTR